MRCRWCVTWAMATEMIRVAPLHVYEHSGTYISQVHQYVIYYVWIYLRHMNHSHTKLRPHCFSAAQRYRRQHGKQFLIDVRRASAKKGTSKTRNSPNVWSGSRCWAVNRYFDIIEIAFFVPREQMSLLNSLDYYKYKLWNYPNLKMNKAGLKPQRLKSCKSDTCQKLTFLLITRSLSTELIVQDQLEFCIIPFSLRIGS